MEEPVIEVEQQGRRRISGSGRWLFTWRLRNQTADTLRLMAVRVPHGRFKAAQKIFTPTLEIPSKTFTDLELSVDCDEAPNTIVENAFLILLVEWRLAQWRLFARLEIRVDSDGAVDAVTESITVQRAGFSGIS